MIIISQVEPISEPILDETYWLLSRFGSSSSSASMVNFFDWAKDEKIGDVHDTVPPIEYQNQYQKFLGLSRFSPDEIKVQLDRNNRQIIIDGHHERINEWETETFQFTKRILIPNKVDLDKLQCYYERNGLIMIQAPIEPLDEKSKHVKREIEVSQTVPIEPTFKNVADAESIENQANKNLADILPPKPIDESVFHSKQRKSELTKIPQGLVPVNEIPIRLIRRPIDQGILCPCCNGKGSRMEHWHAVTSGKNDHRHEDFHQNLPKFDPKKDHQPKNSKKISQTFDEASQNLKDAIDELQNVLPIETKK
ncbi:hypothetical protein SSS_10525 [Sarcoptes scabiei]|uniref:SHSP domain-containing protein n=1 Tax=Sarcoptes scabiei TaxID=52283 RepID=A0A834R4G9_SARSC|nr:hypothetical protein SSS_10525 [Sarcoptes scabiei]